MQTIGLNMCTDKKLTNYISKFTTKIINLEDILLKKINTTIIDPTIIYIDYLECTSCIKIYLETKIKILFLLDSEDNYCYETFIPSVEYIPINKFIDGNKVNSFFIKNKIKPQIFIDDIYCKIIDNHTVTLSFYSIINLDFKSFFFISYYIEDNLFLSLSNGLNLKQKTYNNSTTYSNIIFQGSNHRLLFISHTNGQSLISYEDIKFDTQNKNHYIESLKNVNSFYIMNKNTLIVSNNHVLYTYDLNRKKTLKLNLPISSSSFDYPYFDKNNNLLYFLCKIDNKNHLCIFSKNNSIDILYEYEVMYYKVNTSGDKILLKTLTDNKENLIILDFLTRMPNPIILDFPYDKIIKFDFFNHFNSMCILILYTLENYNYLISYNLVNYDINYLCSNFYINDFDIDYDNMNLYVCYKNNNISTVVKIHDDAEKVILQMPKNIKNIAIKKSSI